MTPFSLIPLAYIDPGAGSLLIQILIGTLVAGPFFLRSQIARAWRAIRHRGPTRRAEAGTKPATDEV